MSVVCIYSTYSWPTHLVQQHEKIIPVHHLSHQYHTQDNGSYNSWLEKGVLLCYWHRYPHSIYKFQWTLASWCTSILLIIFSQLWYSLKRQPFYDAGRWNPEGIIFHILHEVICQLMFAVVSRLWWGDVRWHGVCSCYGREMILMVGRPPVVHMYIL